MKKYLVLLITILILASILFSACSNPTPATTTHPETVPPSTIQTPQTEGESKTITLKWAMSTPENLVPAPQWAIFASELEKRTKGRVKVAFYYMGSLAKNGEELAAVTSGLADIAGTPTSPYARTWPLISLYELPSINFPDTADGLVAYANAQETMYNEFPEFQQYYKDFKVVKFEGTPVYYLHSNKQIHVPTELKGMKVGVSGARGDLATSLGAAAVPILLPDQYMGLKTGQIDTIMSGWSGINSLKLYEVVKYHFEVSLGRTALLTFMNKNSWNRLSSEDQKIFSELLPQIYKEVAAAHLGNTAKGRSIVAGIEGHTILKPTDEEASLWAKASENTEQIWLANINKAGISVGEKVLARYKQLAASYK